MGSINPEQPTSATLCAVVTGANRGIGLAITRQLAEKGVTVVLTSRNEMHGISALQSLRRELNFSNIIFHQLDVQDPVSVANLVEFIDIQFGKLDILVNNAGAPGASVDIEGLKGLNIDAESWLSGKASNIVQGFIRCTYSDALTCFDTNYYGCKRMTEAFLPLLKCSTEGARIVNLSSLRGELKRIPNQKIRDNFDDIENLNEEIIENMLKRFMDDMKDDKLESRGWPTTVPIYSISKTALNAYTRIIAKRHPQMYVNCVHPGFVKTDLNFNMGIIGTEEGAKGPVMLALVPANGPSGCYFVQTTISEY
ncbi:uncharacterized protein A4U43_C09F11390 [Asparagus officinalis]|uniref:Uncharacterized protein n=1 Tax=Asparagus officinalis TaxID=4686 RepID=A0A5P1E6W1_ASPOF|nr:short-chain dehydrogenase/reductase 2b-like [Asparagus officinalis]ONK58354.1 uncharacterized protein A4U43_C09F11390 [Asparagus officinalis]